MVNSEWKVILQSPFATHHSPKPPKPILLQPNPFFAGLVALSKATRPDPIPNSAVKRLSANGTLSQDTGE